MASPKDAAAKAAYEAAYAAYRARKPIVTAAPPAAQMELTEAQRARLVGKIVKPRASSSATVFAEDTMIDGVLYRAGSPFKLPKGWAGSSSAHTGAGVWA